MDAESIQSSGVTNHLARAGPGRAEPRESTVREICGTVVPKLKTIPTVSATLCGQTCRRENSFPYLLIVTSCNKYLWIRLQGG